MQQINNEVIRLTGVDVRSKLAKFFVTSRVENILKLVQLGKVDQLRMDVAAAAGKATNHDIQSM